MTEIQKIILTCLLGPEDKTAWERDFLRRWRLNNPDKAREGAGRYHPKQAAANKRSYEKHRVRRCKEVKEYRALNQEKVSALNKAMKARKKSRPLWRTVAALRTRLRDALRGQGVKKSLLTMELLGCPVVWLQVHLESLFKPGMTWENRGSVWHVDHIKPCAKFDLSNPEQQRICFHWTNLQPLFAEENLRKGDRHAG